jgi:hypothetical protein
LSGGWKLTGGLWWIRILNFTGGRRGVVTHAI